MKSGKYKILHLLSQRPDSTGSGFYIRAMLKESKDRDHHNYLMAGLSSEDTSDTNDIEAQEASFIRFGGHDISYDIVGMSDVMPYDSKRFCDLSEQDIDEYEDVFLKRISKIIENYQPDIIHTHHLWIMSSLVKRRFPQIPTVATCHGSDIRQFRKCTNLQGKVLEGIRQVEGIMALSGMVKEEIAELYRVDKSRIFVTGAGYNDEIFVNIKKPVPPPVVICYAGKLSRSKGVPWLLKALKKLPETGWEFHLCGSGTGQENEECLRLASELGRRMTVHGAVHQNELARIMQKSHIFILPSFYEGLPLVVLEALASGCRIIATDLPGIREIASKTSEGSVTQIRTPRLHSIDEPFEDDEGNFVNELADSISSVMQKVMEKPDLTDEGVKLFTWSGVFEQVQEVYRKVLK